MMKTFCKCGCGKVYDDTRNINDWPYPKVEEMFEAGDRSWLEVSEETYWDQLECVPPAHMKGGCFMVGEPWDHRERGAIHSAFAKFGERYFCRLDYLIDFDPAKYSYLISRQLGLLGMADRTR